MRKLDGLSIAVKAAILTWSWSPAAAAGADPAPAATEAEFAPLDEIDRVRREGGGWLEQVIWTDYMMKVGKLADPSAPGHWVDRQDYLGQFRIMSIDYRVSREAGATAPDPRFRRITLTRPSKTQYRVDWQGCLPFGEVESADRDASAGAYIFEHKKDCWYLTGDLR